VALVWANLAGGSSNAFWNHSLHVAGLPGSYFGTVREWVDNGLMSVFFLAVGLEVGRERAHGALRTHRRALLPVMAALGGMAGAAVTYLCTVTLAGGGGGLRIGWGVPMATDVAFALAAMTVLGHRVPQGIRAFVLALAVADDVASVLVLALVAHSSVHVWALGGTVAVLTGTVALRRWAPRHWPLFVAAALAACVLFAWAGLEPPLGAAFVGILVPHPPPGPASPPVRAGVGRRGRTTGSTFGGTPASSTAAGPLLERVAAPVSGAVVVPIFVLANAGLVLDWHQLAGPSAHSVLIAVLAARVVGKTAGIALVTMIVVRSGASSLPEGSNWTHLFGAAALCGVGFTVPLLFATAIFSDRPALFAAAQAGLLLGTVLALLVGGALLVVAGRTQRVRRDHGELDAPAS
jgi:Na+/H+ antiporter NhaA